MFVVSNEQTLIRFPLQGINKTLSGTKLEQVSRYGEQTLRHITRNKQGTNSTMHSLRYWQLTSRYREQTDIYRERERERERERLLSEHISPKIM